MGRYYSDYKWTAGENQKNQASEIKMLTLSSDMLISDYRCYIYSVFFETTTGGRQGKTNVVVYTIRTNQRCYKQNLLLTT